MKYGFYDISKWTDGSPYKSFWPSLPCCMLYAVRLLTIYHLHYIYHCFQRQYFRESKGKPMMYVCTYVHRMYIETRRYTIHSWCNCCWLLLLWELRIEPILICEEIFPKSLLPIPIPCSFSSWLSSRTEHISN